MAAIYFDMGSGANVGGTPISVHHNVFWNIGHSGGWQSTELSDIYTLPRCGTCGYFPEKISAHYYNNTFAGNVKNYVTYQTAIADVMRNNISLKELNFNWGAGPSNVANAILMNSNPQFAGGDLTTLGGLYFRLSASSPARNAGVAIPGITDGAVGTPDIGAYEFGGQEWVPGYRAVAVTPPANSPPVVSITSPANNSSFTQGANVNVTANATDNGSITRVEFFNGNTKIGEDLTAPYSFTWNSVPAGIHSLTARATDNHNAVTTSAVVRIDVAAAAVPVVSITSPTNNANVALGNNVTIAATATDANGTIAKVEFYNGAVKLGEDTSAPYSYTWTSPAAGSYALTAKATDNDNNTTTSAVVNIVVATANANPIVSITAPANLSSFAEGTAIDITATASDPNGTVTKVEFFNGNTKIGEDTSSPYAFKWTNAPMGTQSITAKAIDNQNASTISTVVTVIVSAAATPQNLEPVVSLTSPASNASFSTGESITLAANASDSDGRILRVEFLVNGVKIGEAQSAPYTITWKNVEAGVYKIAAVAWDDKSGVTTSDQITVSVMVDFPESPVENLSAGIPRFFSPNSDGTGDVWAWSNDEVYANAALTVYSRSGKAVYASEAYSNNWDGTSKGQPLQEGDYYYVVTLQNLTELRGSVRIIR